MAVSTHRHGLWRRFWIASAVVIVCTAMGVGLFLRAYTALVRTSFRDRTTAYAEAFAANVESWIARGQSDVARSLAHLLVTGSVLSVEVAGEKDATFAAGAELDPLPEGEGKTPAVTQRWGGGVLDIVVPMSSSDGHVRIAVDVSSCETTVRQAILLAVGGGVAFDAGVAGLLAWALRSRRRKEGDGAASGHAKDDTISVGDLVIIPSRCQAAFAGKVLRLTPKQFALLSVLARDPGRVFSEAEILAAAWPDSSYADARDIKQYVYLLRRRLEAIQPGGRAVIVTVPGFGYRLDDGR